MATLGTSQQVRDETYQPQRMDFTPEGLGLLEAVRLSLIHDPNIHLSEASAEFQEGVVQEQKGQFDTTLLASLAGEYRQQELSESRKKSERDKRERLDRGIRLNRENRREAQQLLHSLIAVQNAPQGEKVDTIPDPDIRTNIQVIDILIGDQTSPEARDELLSIREQFLSATIDRLAEGLENVLDGFQDAVQLRRNLGGTPQDEYFRNGTADVQLMKPFRNGITISTFMNGAFDGTNFVGKERSTDFGGKGLEEMYTFRFGINSRVPLLRGRGTDARGATERAAEIDHDASLLSLQFQSSVSALNTVLAYWDLRGAQESLDVIQRSVGLQEQIVSLTEAAIEAGELPRADIARVRASEARALARLQNMERNYHQARVNLAAVMGLEVTDNDQTLPLARDGFPAAPKLATLEEQEVQELAREALDLRPDLRAHLTLEQSGKVLKRAAVTDLRPKLDLDSSLWVTALDERTVYNAIDRWVGPSLSLAVDFERPFGNNFYKGRLKQRDADLRQRQIKTMNLARQIQLAIVRDALSLDQAASRVALANEAVNHYRTAIDSEIEKFRVGESTLIDTILTEDQQTDAQLSRVAAEQDFAKLVAELRFEAGILVNHHGQTSAVSQEDLTAVPFKTGSQR